MVILVVNQDMLFGESCGEMMGEERQYEIFRPDGRDEDALLVGEADEPFQKVRFVEQPFHRLGEPPDFFVPREGQKARAVAVALPQKAQHDQLLFGQAGQKGVAQEIVGGGRDARAPGS